MSSEQGGITVFLSLSILLIMSLLGTMVEVTRGKICRVHSRRTLKVAAERLMTEYSRPLYDRYGLFFLEDTGEPFQQCMARYAGEILNAKELYEGTLAELEVSERHYAGDDGGKVLLSQIEEKMKRQIAEDLIRGGWNKHQPALSVEESAQTIEEKVEQEREEAEAGICLLELMTKVDGVTCASGDVQGEKYFAKMFYRGENRGENLGITEAIVWDAIKDNMVSLEDTLPQLMDSSVRNTFRNQVEKARKRTEEALEIMRDMGEKLATLQIGRDPISVLEGNRLVLEKTEQYLAEEMTSEVIAELEELWKNYDTSGIVFSYTGVTETGGGENPIESFSETLSGGILNLVLKENETVSDKRVESADGYCEWYEASGEETDYKDRVKSFSKEQEVELQGALGEILSLSASDYLLCEYVKKYFGNWCHSLDSDNTSLDYELEYLICGKDSDKKNLEQVVNRLFLVRTAVNTTTLLASSAKRETAYAAALSVVGFTGVEPLVRLTQTLLLVSWGMAESLVDVAAILQGRQVPLVKSSSQLKVEFPELFQVSRGYVLRQAKEFPQAGERSFGYEDYVTLFLLSNKREETCYRMMDIMQANVRKDGVEHFNFGMCVDSFQATGVFTFPTKFFRVPRIHDILERQLYEYHSRAQVTMTYVGE